jgi:hypothetical protein
MKPSERYALVGLCCAAALASGAAVHALGSYGGPVPAAEPLTQSASVAVETSPDLREAILPPAHSQDEDRFAFLSDEAVPALMWALTETPDSENPDSWIAETRPELSEPSQPSSRVSALPPQRLPWQAAEPKAPARRYSLQERLSEISPAATQRLTKKFEAAKAPWPPADIGLVGLKDEKILELFARPKGGPWQLIHRYPVLAASGAAGPKLRQGDKQVPEGIYSISFLNPNSRYHVSLRVNYPNAFDRRMAAKDGRKTLGGDIMIHGKAASVGCLAIGDAAAEELFVLADRTGLRNIKLIIAPTDFRGRELPVVGPDQPEWLPKLYTEVASAMSEFMKPPSSGLLSFFLN